MELSEQITQSDPDNTPDAESTGSDKVIIKFNLRGTPQGHNNCPGNPQINTQQGGGDPWVILSPYIHILLRQKLRCLQHSNIHSMRK